jgi:hypothetical protein
MNLKNSPVLKILEEKKEREKAKKSGNLSYCYA